MTHISLHAVMFIIIILVITFMHGIYNYVPDTNHLSRLYSVAAVLYMQLMLHVMLFRPCNIFCTFTSALPTVCGQYPMWLFFVFPQCHGILLRYHLNDFETVPVTHIITDITFAVKFHMH